MEVRPKTIVDAIDTYWDFPAQEQERPLAQSPVLDSSNAAKIHSLYDRCHKLDATLLPTGTNRASYDEALGAMDMAFSGGGRATSTTRSAGSRWVVAG